MNMKQGIELSQKARALGYAMRVKTGKVQLVVVTDNGKGCATESPRSSWMGYTEALEDLACRTKDAK